MKSEEEKEEFLEEKFDKIKDTLNDAMIAGRPAAIGNPFINNDLRTLLGIYPAASLKTKPWDTPDGIDAATYMGIKPPIFELNGTVEVKRIIYDTGECARTIELPFPVHIPKSSRANEDYFNIIKELLKHLKEYNEVLQILSNKNILVKEHFGIFNLSFSLSDEELDKFMTCLEKLNKCE